MNKIKISKSYIADGKLQGKEFEITIHSPIEVFVKERISDAEMLARNNGGELYIDQNKAYLYINYLDVPNTNMIDKIYKF